ncbi:hypothetical protein [Alkalihalobacillus sp. AL-G]|uniref:hypothetical protein n=1 Tax=Alkalihalobacillus sp. AL-G TaxID=2926399 RepID=UPI00272BF33C|nr:hypothetical protein [Alkalihalobacillus sp. AL-G]WLD93630.1 hypothetical protein MOJ78_01440 [Alkalihalobacillus sp. AL-G]
MKSYILRWLFRLNVSKSTLIITLLSSPWLVSLFLKDTGIATAILWAYTAVGYFFISFLLLLFLKLISTMRKSEVRKRLVTFARVYIRFHVASALLGVYSLYFHVSYMLDSGWVKTSVGLAGVLALIGLAGVLFTGYLRKQKSSGRRRRYHRYFAYVFVASTILHMVL